MLSQTSIKIQDCKYCPFQEFDFNKSKELGFGNKYRIMFVGSSPAISSNKSCGKSKFDLFFNNLLSKVDISKRDYYFTNLCKTSIPKNLKLTEEQVQHCLSHLKEEIKEVKPQIIVLLGSICRDAFWIRYPDKVYNMKIGSLKIKVYPIAHPGFLHYEPAEEKSYLKKLTKIHKYYKRILI